MKKIEIVNKIDKTKSDCCDTIKLELIQNDDGAICLKTDEGSYGYNLLKIDTDGTLYIWKEPLGNNRLIYTREVGNYCDTYKIISKTYE